ncbi:MAG TPA: hypothetical protein VFY92_05190, partial [Hyphomicrobiaceae bacterium]|nr:hypothetical protein [Hyphomicrobiaceae bacterium]
TGVRGHLEHIRLYAGHPVANPVAERTRKVHEWHILDRWQRSLHHPVTYTDLATKWAPGTRDYTRSIKAIGDQFRKVLCHAPDPHPELVQEARAGRKGTAQAADASSPAPSGEELAQRAVAQGKAEGTDRRSSLGAQPSRTSNKPSTVAASPAAAAAPYKVTNAPAARQPAAAEKAGTARYALAGAAAAGHARPKIVDTAAPPAANQRCRVWTASYGGQKSIIIRSVADQVVNFTVLDVNDGAERREAEAFIDAYAKNGKITGEYPSQALALDRAFELCPEG